MKVLKNTVKCSNCGSENSIYKLTCVECGSYLRERVVNIDLWKSLWTLLYEPTTAFKKIIFAEHKNFVSVLLLIVSIKVILVSAFVSNYFNTPLFSYTNLFVALSILLFISILLIFTLAYLVTEADKMLGLSTRFKDNLSLLTYSFIPIIISLIILTPIEYAIFGKYWFLHNPSPFFINSFTGYILVGIEVLMLLWTILLFATGVYFQSKNKIYSMIVSIITFAILFASIIFLSVNFPNII
ncbi:Yip1 domain protein [bacterium BMS3Abin04]|nr:Yip1 domain protein [bacterium BMS3Abin04]